jgi:hypothetical protein
MARSKTDTKTPNNKMGNGKAIKLLFQSWQSLITLVILAIAIYYLTTPKFTVGLVLLIIAILIVYFDFKENKRDKN